MYRHALVSLPFLVALLMLVPLLAGDEHPVHFDDVDWQEATPADINLLEPYLGTFRGKTYTADGGTEYYFTVTYEWYDRPQTIIKFILTTHLPQTGEERPLGEGYYRFDPFTRRIAVNGVFRDGRSGAGFVSPFDRETHAREVRIHDRGPDGKINEIRDTFWMIDENSWGNRTYLSVDGGDWQVISEDTYTRVKS